MNRSFVCYILALLLVPDPLWAVEAAPALTDREIAERLTRLEEGQHGLREDMGQLRADMQHLRADMNRQNEPPPRRQASTGAKTQPPNPRILLSLLLTR